ncbi:MAG: hypothetical protein MUP69_10250 [Candidatus Atribacteria bacterium]|nr:hypothetical protein [Candidatus Atribacteria bacterium]
MKKEEIQPNTIYYTTNLSTLIKVVEKTDLVKNSDLLQSDFIKLLGVYIVNKSGMVLVSFGEDGELNGCLVISRHLDKWGEYIFIDFAWIDSHYPHLKEKFYEEVITTCKDRGIKRIQMRMSKGEKAMRHLYGTRVIGKILEKKVE